MKYYAGCICINHALLISPPAALSPGATFVLCVTVPSPLACWLLSFFISTFSILHPSVQQALIERLVYTLFLFVGPGQGHWMIVDGKGFAPQVPT